MSEAIKRASFLPEDMSDGGGSLFGSAGPARASIVGGSFTKVSPYTGPGAENVSGNPIFAKVELVLAGSAPIEERTVAETFSLGAQAGDNFEISADGDYLIPTNDHAQIVKDSKWGTFAQSLYKYGVSKEILSAFQFSKIVGLDGDFKRVADKERVFANQIGTKKKFPPSTLQLIKLHALKGEVAKTGAAAKTATTTAPVAATGADLDGDAWPVLETVLKADKSVQRGRLVLAASKVLNNSPEYATLEPAQRKAIANRIGQESFIVEMVSAGMVSYAATEKGQPVSLAA